MTKFRLEFDTDMFLESWRPKMIQYLKGEITTQEASKYLGIPRPSWERVMGNVFTAATTPDHEFASIKEIKEGE